MKRLRLPDGRELCYELTRKPVRNINFRVKPDGVVYVSASGRVAVKRIEQLLTERADFLLAAAQRLSERERQGEITLESVKWLGREFPVRIIASAREKAVLEHDEMRVFSCRTGDEEWLRGLIKSELTANFARLCAELTKEVRAQLTAAGLVPPPTRITIKDMKSRWGSCSYTRGHISINFQLYAYPRETVLSVFWHEYAHYWQHDHSPAFYALVERFCPEYRRWNGLLK